MSADSTPTMGLNQKGKLPLRVFASHFVATLGSLEVRNLADLVVLDQPAAAHGLSSASTRGAR